MIAAQLSDLSFYRHAGAAERHQPDRPPAIAVLIPCLNEELTIGKVVDDFRRALPAATVYVFDNCSTDATARVAQEHGAVVVKECRKGKGFVVESMFDRIDADFYIMVDGDDTYPVEDVHRLLQPVLSQDADMVVGARLVNSANGSFRRFHMLGNKLVCRLVNWVGDSQLTDIMSGYRGFNRHVLSRIPVVSAGFEVETEMTLQMLYYGRRVVEIDVPYRERPAGSVSKLRTFYDGFRVLWTIFSLFRAFKPLTFFGGLGLLFVACGLMAGLVPLHDYITDPDHFVRHVPLAILATGLVLLGSGFALLGILLHAVNWRFKELHNVLTRG
jgi:glycosyltransferase involved in cell wall biosynthesis